MKYMKKILLGVLVSLFIPTIAKAESLKVGDYIYMKPTKTNYTIPSSLTGHDSDQTINPSELTLWRIIDIKSDGTFDAVSEYLSSKTVEFKGVTGYAKYVGTLQTIASQYQNSEYTIGSRMMGYDGQTLTISDTSAFDGTNATAPSTNSTPLITSGTGEEYDGGVTGDTLYLKDLMLVGNVYKSDVSVYYSNGLKAYDVSKITTSRAYWLASRRYGYSSPTAFVFSGNCVGASATISSDTFRRYGSGSWNDFSSSNFHVRPIVTLKSGLIINDGEGTKESPYTLVISPIPEISGSAESECENFNAKDVNLKVGEKLDYKSTIGIKDYQFNITNTDIASIDSNGIITAKKEGTTTMTVLGDCKYVQVTITVEKESTSNKEEKEEITEETKVNEDTRTVETEKNPNTGNQKYYVFGLVLIITSILIYIVIKKKNILN